MGILKFIFIILLGTFALGEIIRFNLVNNISIKPVDIAVIILTATWIIYHSKNFIKIIRSESLFVPIILVIIVMFVSLALNYKNFLDTEILAAFSYIGRWALYAFLFFIVKSFPKNFKEKILYLLLISGGLFTLFGFIQYLFYSNLRNLYYLGWDEHMRRLFSTFLDPNFAGAFLVVYLFFLLGVIFYLFKNNQLKKSWFLGIIAFFTLLSIFLTYSRSALVTLLASTIIFSILIKKVKLIFAILFFGLIFIIISSKNFNIENINLFRIASTEARVDSAKIAIEIIKNNSIFGVGFNTYRYVQVKYGFRNPDNTKVSHADSGTDNSFLFIFATTGIVGLILYLNLLWRILKISYLNYKQSKSKDFQRYIAIIAITSIGGIIVNSFFINSLFYSFVLIWIWILLGLMNDN